MQLDSINPEALLAKKNIEHIRLEKLQPGQVLVSVDPAYFRPTEVATLIGNPAKEKLKLGWEPEISIDTLVTEMVDCDLQEAGREKICVANGFPIPGSLEEHM